MASHVLAHYRSATHHYALHERFEAGLVLLGSEVKSLRQHQSSLEQAYIIEQNNELFLHNAHIHEYHPSAQFGHSPRRDRKLLLHKRQINRIIGGLRKKGQTAVPLKLYLTSRGMIKLEIALASGLKKHDKRESIKQKEWNRQKMRVLKQGQNE
jgi:SsrA-binding protein